MVNAEIDRMLQAEENDKSDEYYQAKLASNIRSRTEALENEVCRLRGELIKCSAFLLLHRLSDYHEDWPSKMTKKNMDIIKCHNEQLRLKAIQLRESCNG